MKAPTFTYALAFANLSQFSVLGDFKDGYWSAQEELLEYDAQVWAGQVGSSVTSLQVPSRVEFEAAGLDFSNELSISFFLQASLQVRFFALVPDVDTPTTAEGVQCMQFLMDRTYFSLDGFQKRRSIASKALRCELGDIQSVLGTYRGGVHVSFVVRGSQIEYYFDGIRRCVGSNNQFSANVTGCAGGRLLLGDNFPYQNKWNGFIRDLRFYPRALSAAEINSLVDTCRGAPQRFDDPSYRGDTSIKESCDESSAQTAYDSCLQWKQALDSRAIATCSAEATMACPIACTNKPICGRSRAFRAPGVFGYDQNFVTSSSVEVAPGRDIRSFSLCVNTNVTTWQAMLDRCDRWYPKDTWPEYPTEGRRLGHIPSPECPGKASKVPLPDLDSARDLRVWHDDANCDFDGRNLGQTIAGYNQSGFTIYWWSRTSPAIDIRFTHTLWNDSTYNCYDIQRGKAYAQNIYGEFRIGPNGENTYSDSTFGAMTLSNIDKTGMDDRWVMAALVVNGTHTSYFTDGDFATVEYISQCPYVEFIEFVGWKTDRSTLGKYSQFRFLPRPLMIQQLQDIFYDEGDRERYHLCPPGSFHDPKGGCSPCAPHTFTDEEGMFECTKCPKGFEQPDVGQSMCNVCKPGFFSMESGQVCSLCPLGTFTSTNSSTDCTHCDAGRFANPKGQVECKDCFAGTYSDMIRAPSCTSCLPGTYAKNNASQGCESCPIGKYQPNGTASECYDCPHRSYATKQVASKSSLECTCAENFYLNRRTNQCVNCESLLGFFCPGGLGLPLLQDGYYGEPVGDPNLSLALGDPSGFESLTVWTCPVGDNCKGVRNHSTCPPHMEGFGCSICQQDYSKSGDGLSCEPCEGGGLAMLPVGLLVLILITYLVCRVINGKPYNPTVNDSQVFQGLVAITVTFIQMTYIVVQFSLQWPQWFRSTGESVGGMLMFSPELLKPACHLGHSLTARMIPGLTAPFVLLFALLSAAMFVNNASSKVVAKLTPPVSVDDLLNTAGVFFMSLYVATCKVTFSFIECQSHPNADATLVQYPDITCWSSEHHQAIWVFILGLVVNVVLVWAVLFWFNANAVKLFETSPNRARWRKRLRFLIGTWQPHTWYWGQLYMSRNLLVSLITAFEPNDGYFQSFLLLVFLLIPSSLTGLMHPWRHPLNNYADIALIPMLALVAICSAAHVRVNPKLQDDVLERANTTIVIVMICASMTIFGLFLRLLVGEIIGSTVTRAEEARAFKMVEAMHRVFSLGKELDRIQMERFIASIENKERETLEQTFSLLNSVLWNHSLTPILTKTDSRLKRMNSSELTSARISERIDESSEHEPPEQNMSTCETKLSRYLEHAEAFQPIPSPVEETTM